jgi:bifunctional non-homologous end joining protein LigD
VDAGDLHAAVERKVVFGNVGPGPDPALKLVRYTHGITFYHRGPLPEIPPSVHQLHIRKRQGGEGVRLWIDDLDGLLGLVDMDAVGLHLWNATVEDIEHADRVVLDVDPGAGFEWAQVYRDKLAVA